MKKFLQTTAAIAVALSVISSAQALSYDLLTPQASILDGNAVSAFYTVQVPGLGESGSAASLYSTTVGGNENDGFWVKISFDGNPQPVLTSAILKASDQYLLWDSSDLAGFNAGTFDSITLWNSGGPNQGIGHWTGNPNRPANQQWKFHGTSHAALNGEPGTGVPEGGTTLILLGAGLAAMGAGRRLVKL